jgi:hypothetical protein
MVKFGDGGPIWSIIKRDQLFSLKDNLLQAPGGTLLARIMRCRPAVGLFARYDDESVSKTYRRPY